MRDKSRGFKRLKTKRSANWKLLNCSEATNFYRPTEIDSIKKATIRPPRIPILDVAKFGCCLGTEGRTAAASLFRIWVMELEATLFQAFVVVHGRSVQEQ